MPIICPECRAESRDGKPFCGKCGAGLPAQAGALAATAEPPGGRSRVELDPQLINSLLAVFVNRPDGTQMELSEGRLRIRQGTLNVVLEPVQIKDALRFQLSNGPLGPFRIQVDQLQLGQRGLEIELKLS
jgi:hypothetical protein